jgi:hypothetical protein
MFANHTVKFVIKTGCQIELLRKFSPKMPKYPRNSPCEKLKICYHLGFTLFDDSFFNNFQKGDFQNEKL